MTTATPPAPYSTMEGALASGFAITQLHHSAGHDRTRRVLVIAATVLLAHSNDWNSLKAWGVRLAKRIGFSKARIAVARKLAMIMHKIWLNNDRFRPKIISAAERTKLKNELSGAAMKSRPVASAPV